MSRPSVRIKAVLEVPAGDLCQDLWRVKCPYLTPIFRCSAFDYSRCEFEMAGPDIKVYKCEACRKAEVRK